MAASRIAYGLAKKYGIDTTGMTPGEVWDALKDKGVNPENIGKGAYNSRNDIQPLKKADRDAKKTYTELPKKEYAELCSAIRTKFTNKIPIRGHMLYGNNYYRFKYDRKQEKIVCTKRVKIKGNEELISELMKQK